MPWRVLWTNCPTAARLQRQAMHTFSPLAAASGGLHTAITGLWKSLAPRRCSPPLRRWERFVPDIGRCCTRVSMRCCPRRLMSDLFTASPAEERRDEAIAPGAVLLRGFALPFVDNVLAEFGDI